MLAPDLPGMEQEPRALGDDALAEWAAFVAGLASEAEGPEILVGHSRGGVGISEVAERVPDRIDRLVYLTAFLLESGQSLADVANRYPEIGPGPHTRPAENPSRLVVELEPAIAIFYNRVADKDARAATVRLVPEPTAALTTPVRLTAERFGRVPRAYIECTDDRASSLAMQLEMQAALPCDPVITLDCDHSPFYSAVPELAEALLSLAAN